MHVDVKDGLARVFPGVDPHIKSTDGCIPPFNSGLHLDQHLMHVRSSGSYRSKYEATCLLGIMSVCSSRVTIPPGVTVLPFLQQFVVIEVTKKAIFHVFLKSQNSECQSPRRWQESNNHSPDLFLVMAERVGFEPTVPCGTTVFETAPFDHLAPLRKSFDYIKDTGPCSRILNQTSLITKKGKPEFETFSVSVLRSQFAMIANQIRW